MGAYRPKDRAEVARNMAAIRSQENRTESALRSALHRMGLRYRKYPAAVFGKPDIVFPKERVAVFVDGDYWHGRFLRERGMSATKKRLAGRPNEQYWLTKFQRNMARDDNVTATLKDAGWSVLRLWESDVKRDIPAAARQVAAIVRTKRGAGRRIGMPKPQGRTGGR